MKKHSLVEQEILDAFVYVMYIILGVIGLINRESIISLVIAGLAIVLFFAVIIMRFKRKFDVWDETAKEHYATARRISLLILKCIGFVLVILGLIFRLEFTVGAFHLMIALGCSSILPSIVFIVLEKRDV